NAVHGDDAAGDPRGARHSDAAADRSAAARSRRAFRERGHALPREGASGPLAVGRGAAAHIEAFATPGSGVTALAGGGGAGVVRRRPAALLTAALVAVVILGAATWFGPGRRARERHWAREQGIPQLLALAELGLWDSAYTL